MMDLDKNEWSYGQTLDEERMAYLSDNTNFSVVTAEIEKQLAKHFDDCTFKIDPGCDVPGRRPVFVFPVGRKAGDTFFNGVSGYRAQYYRSPETGSIQNGRLLDWLTPQLLKVAKAHSFADEDNVMSKAQVASSLALPSAKAWGDETEKLFWDHMTAYHDESDIEIAARRWTDNLASANGEMKGKAECGVRAPWPGFIKIMGGFIDNDGNEHVAEHKRRRACDIFECGFS